MERSDANIITIINTSSTAIIANSVSPSLIININISTTTTITITGTGKGYSKSLDDFSNALRGEVCKAWVKVKHLVLPHAHLEDVRWVLLDDDAFYKPWNLNLKKFKITVVRNEPFDLTDDFDQLMKALRHTFSGKRAEQHDFLVKYYRERGCTYIAMDTDIPFSVARGDWQSYVTHIDFIDSSLNLY